MNLDELIRILSLGAGVQSSTLALMGAYGYIKGISAAVFADTQAEPAEVYAWLALLEKLIAESPHPFPVYRVTAGDLGDECHRLRTSRKTGNRYVRTLIPAFVANESGGRALMGRRCTAEFKVRAIMKKVREIAQIKRGCKTPVVEQVIGISFDETIRMKPSMEPWAINSWPLIDMKMTRDDCKTWMSKNGFPEPPRSSCVFCPFHSDEEWQRLSPYEFDRAVQFERKLQEAARNQTGTARLQGDVFLHSSLVPLDRVVFKTRPGHLQVDMFGNECEGLCGV